MRTIKAVATKILKVTFKGFLNVFLALAFVCAIVTIGIPVGLVNLCSGISRKIVEKSERKKIEKFKEEIKHARALEVASLEYAEFDYIKRHSANVATKEKTMIDVAEELVENINLDDFEV